MVVPPVWFWTNGGRGLGVECVCQDVLEERDEACEDGGDGRIKGAMVVRVEVVDIRQHLGIVAALRHLEVCRKPLEPGRDDVVQVRPAELVHVGALPHVFLLCDHPERIGA